jgi:hypothetical protein
MDKWLNKDDYQQYLLNKINIKEHKTKTFYHKNKRKSRKKVVKIKCDYCGKVIFTIPCRLREYKHHFCNKFHHNLFRRKL